MEFEFDPLKSSANKDKHGIDFEEARSLWLDENLVLAAARSAGEKRQVALGFLKGRHWAAFFTMRGDRIRIISVRRARQREIERYENDAG